MVSKLGHIQDGGGAPDFGKSDFEFLKNLPPSYDRHCGGCAVLRHLFILGF